MMEFDLNALFGIKSVEHRSLTYACIQASQAKLRMAAKIPQMVVCHPDKHDKIYAAMEAAGALRLGTIVKSSDYLTDEDTVYLIWDQPEDEDDNTR